MLLLNFCKKLPRLRGELEGHASKLIDDAFGLSEEAAAHGTTWNHNLTPTPGLSGQGD